MNKKVLVSDYDQTFYLNDNDIKLNNKMIEKFRKEGNIFVIATGRSLIHFLEKKDKYNINYDYVILNHGAEIIDNKKNKIINITIDNNIIEEIKNDLNLENRVDGFLINYNDEFVDWNASNIIKINVKYNSVEKAKEINNLINDKYKDYVTSYYVNKNSIELISNKINKSSAIKLLMNNINIDNKNVYTIGDNYSDIDMIKDFNGYCMNDSIKEVKEVAKKEYNSVSLLIKDILNNEI